MRRWWLVAHTHFVADGEANLIMKTIAPKQQVCPVNAVEYKMKEVKNHCSNLFMLWYGRQRERESAESEMVVLRMGCTYQPISNSISSVNIINYFVPQTSTQLSTDALHNKLISAKCKRFCTFQTKTHIVYEQKINRNSLIRANYHWLSAYTLQWLNACHLDDFYSRRRGREPDHPH